jgi:signal transduction histidine kinase
MTMRRLQWSSSLWPQMTGRTTPRVWRTWSTPIERFLPYTLLVISVVLNQAKGGLTWGQREATLGLAGAAAAWLLVTVTLVPKRFRDNAYLAAVSFSGLMVLATLLMQRDTLFLVFMIAAFFHALHLRPAALALLGLATTSMQINTVPVGGPAHAFSVAPGFYATIVIIQTAAIGGGSMVTARVFQQNEERRKALEDLAAAHEENAGLHRQLLAQAREAGMLDERQRLSQEIHDTLAQGFTGIITQLEAAEHAGENWAERQRHLATATALARENLAEARRSVRALRPEQLDAATLPEALAEVTSRWAERAGVAVECTTTGNPCDLHPEIEATLLRVTQEALSNVTKHAGAKRVGVTLSYMEDQVTLDVRDDGEGFDPESLPTGGDAAGGFGLPGMRHRVQRLAGTLNIESEPGGGTAVSANVPAIPVGVLP